MPTLPLFSMPGAWPGVQAESNLVWGHRNHGIRPLSLGLFWESSCLVTLDRCGRRRPSRGSVVLPPGPSGGQLPPGPQGNPLAPVAPHPTSGACGPEGPGLPHSTPGMLSPSALFLLVCFITPPKCSFPGLERGDIFPPLVPGLDYPLQVPAHVQAGHAGSREGPTSQPLPYSLL